MYVSRYVKMWNEVNRTGILTTDLRLMSPALYPTELPHQLLIIGDL